MKRSCPFNQHLGVFFNFVTKNHIPLHLIGETRDIILLHFKGLSNIGMEQLTLTINKQIIIMMVEMCHHAV